MSANQSEFQPKTAQKRPFLRIGAAIVSVLAVTVFAVTFIHAMWYAPDAEMAIATTTSIVDSPVMTEIYPSELSIPSIHVQAHVQYVGLTYKGNMGIPNNFTDVAWYKFGTLPGNVGSAVIDGHVDNGLSLAGVFKHLSSVNVGDDIYVTRVDGTQIRFVVKEIDAFDYQNAPTNFIFNENDGRFLKLITCTGDWVQADRTYNHRLVVTAEEVDPYHG